MTSVISEFCLNSPSSAYWDSAIFRRFYTLCYTFQVPRTPNLMHPVFLTAVLVTLGSIICHSLKQSSHFYLSSLKELAS